VLIQAVREKTAGSHVALRGNFSGLVSATDSVKGSKDLTILVLCTQKKNFLVGECGFFVSGVISRGLLDQLGQLHPGPGPKPLDGSISPKFLLETKLQSKSFDTLDDLLGFRVEKL